VGQLSSVALGMDARCSSLWSCNRSDNIIMRGKVSFRVMLLLLNNAAFAELIHPYRTNRTKSIMEKSAATYCCGILMTKMFIYYGHDFRNKYKKTKHDDACVFSLNAPSKP
jgi:hypothetical protein